MKSSELIQKAIDAREMSYSPYSHFAVGAAVLTGDNMVKSGCNVENTGFTPIICAERDVIFKAVSEGKRRFKEIAIVGGLHGPLTGYCSPCGICRQVLVEFCETDKMKLFWPNLEMIIRNTHWANCCLWETTRIWTKDAISSRKIQRLINYVSNAEIALCIKNKGG